MYLTKRFKYHTIFIKSMNVRKLVKSGHSSLVIAVPKQWADRNSLVAGNLVNIEESLNKLIISTTANKEKITAEDIVLDVDGLSNGQILKRLTAAYMNDFHHIILKGKQLKQKAKPIKEAISSLVALELVDEDQGKIVAKSFLDLYDIDLKLILRRMDNIIRSQFIDAKQVDSNPESVDSILSRDIEINRLSFFVFRILKAAYLHKEVLSALGLDELGGMRYWEFNNQLEKIGDRIKNIAEKIPLLERSQKPSFLILFSNMEDVYKDAMKAFYEESPTQAELVSVKRDALVTDIQGFLKASKSTASAQIAINAFNFSTSIKDIERGIRYLKTYK
jgi:phosphate uptake regulator